ncbi:MAG TPA: four-carbon acid sugar kinase family protein [Methylomirabilota bacterium]|nr:four-carbon acid sugar kinase family protein [Methylomirabilota bacterium]
MAKLLVIADDLSGATDVGVQFARQGVCAIVTLYTNEHDANFSELFASFEVVLVDVASRHVTPEEAARRVAFVVREARAVGVENFYKKTDSTLRGNVGAELEALLKATGQQTLYFVPAHPVLGRTTCKGIHFVHGTPLHESAFASDARNPVTESRVASLLAQQTDLPINVIGPKELDDVAQALPEGITVFDAETEGDVQRVATALKTYACLPPLAGAAAFAACLPMLLEFSGAEPKPLRVPAPLLVVNGSLNEVALRQCEVAREHGFSNVPLTPEAALADNEAGERERSAIASRIGELLGAGANVLLSSVQSHADCLRFKEAAQSIVPNANQWPDQIALHTGQLVEKILGRRRSDFALVVFGGDTLAGVAQANRWRGLIPRGEVLPGLALCEIAEQPGLILISKPGGFGDQDVLLKLREKAGA